mmetsp:Transcript_102180/g.286406  ORF Transcript_102180/g.286406 Transcript_102180/m.286406 type:complete len:174 (-) Transcript_102180:297-818(-)
MSIFRNKASTPWVMAIDIPAASATSCKVRVMRPASAGMKPCLAGLEAAELPEEAAAPPHNAACFLLICSFRSGRSVTVGVPKRMEPNPSPFWEEMDTIDDFDEAFRSIGWLDSPPVAAAVALIGARAMGGTGRLRTARSGTGPRAGAFAAPFTMGRDVVEEDRALDKPIDGEE